MLHLKSRVQPGHGTCSNAIRALSAPSPVVGIAMSFDEDEGRVVQYLELTSVFPQLFSLDRKRSMSLGKISV